MPCPADASKCLPEKELMDIPRNHRSRGPTGWHNSEHRFGTKGQMLPRGHVISFSRDSLGRRPNGAALSSVITSDHRPEVVKKSFRKTLRATQTAHVSQNQRLPKPSLSTT